MTDGGALPPREETLAERLDRNWGELLQELRVAQTGAQILTAFLLTVPFQSRFADLTRDQVRLYLLCVALAAVTTGLLVSPVAWHRLAFRHGQKQRLVTLANLSALGGLLALNIVVSATLGLVFWVVLDGRAALTFGMCALVILAGVWFAIPMWGMRRRRASPE